MSVNRVILVGHLGADPESRATPGGMQVANLRLATNHVSYGKDGNTTIYVATEAGIPITEAMRFSKPN